VPGSVRNSAVVEILLPYRVWIILLLAVDAIMNCQPNSAGASLPHSCARPDEVAVSHMDLDLRVDFDSKQLSGNVTLTLNRHDDSKRLHLDSLGQTIHSISSIDGHELSFEVSAARGRLGQCLAIELPVGVDKVVIEYATSPDAAALQWLSPEQTTDRKHPFLFTQSQAILARTWVPCQDTPAVRFTYSARITVPPELMAVMSASNPRVRNERGVYHFEMKQPIPSYLLALAVGDLQFRQIGPRSGVYAEPSVLEKAAWELADTERMITAAEALYGTYRWDRYDIIFLPSSFPFGGMENPRLTFATPTILAGDRSLVALIAHELAHSWSGNLVTNATWNDFWLNEGFTVYFEQRIMEAVYGRPYAEMLARLTLDGLKEEMRTLDDRDTWLKLDLAGRDPDDGMTAIAYDKGYFFLRMLEETVGRDEWDKFVRGYFDRHAFRSMTTEDFVAYLKQNLDPEVNITEWIYGPGLPANCPEVNTAELVEVEKQAKAYMNGLPATEVSVQGWTTHHWLHFLRSLPDPLSTSQMRQLDEAFELTASANSEITLEWMLHVIAADYDPGMTKLEQFLTQQGRRKFLKPLYQKLAETVEGKAFARRIYKKARPTYHAVSRVTIDELLN
jgi:leukotriene-A4 hydrolase